jgi:hypothetical protein
LPPPVTSATWPINGSSATIGSPGAKLPAGAHSVNLCRAGGGRDFSVRGQIHAGPRQPFRAKKHRKKHGGV